ncbi:M1-specific T cell receptor beta chain [Nematolebias whitei]|uniref:M1-specific T cell receptor beta chain n=1 Tax=Nematolebias whitei TaxID=451745 RepID=UPI001898A81A|nr:M1-specific T cell receptor beta chain [Nematolebias whitei]
MISWYQRPAGDSALKLIGYMLYTSQNLEDEFKERFGVSGDGSKKSELQLEKLNAEDSGVYFCVAQRHGSSLSEQVVQTPAETLKRSGETAKISCSHSIQSYDQILWYKQSDQHPMQLLGYMFGDAAFPERGLNVKMEGSANKDKSCTLTVEGSSLSDQVVQTPSFIQASPGGAAKMTCSHSIQSYNQILWYKRSEHGELTLLGYMYLDNSNPEPGVNVLMEGSADEGRNCSLTLRELSVSSSALYFCAANVNNYEPAYFGKGTKLTVLETGREPVLPTVKLLPPSEKQCRSRKEQENKNKRDIRKKTLVCVASGFYPDHVSVSWFINGLRVREGVQTDGAARRVGESYNITSRLTVLAKHWFSPQTVFNCTVDFFDGNKNTICFDSITSQTADEGMGREKYLTITQNAKLSYMVLIVKSCLYGAFVGLLVWKLQVCLVISDVNHQN